MNAKYKDLYQELVSRDLTSLDEDLFYNEYSTNDQKFGELYSYLESEGLTSLDPETFKSEYLTDTPVEKKNPDVTELPLETGSSGRFTDQTTEDPSREANRKKVEANAEKVEANRKKYTKIFTGFPGKGDKEYEFKESDGVAHWYEANPKKAKALAELNAAKNATRPGPMGHGTMPVYSPAEIKKRESEYNKIAEKIIIEDDARVRALNNHFKKNASLDPIDQVYTNYDKEKKDNEYRINDDNWQRKVPGATSWTTVTDEGAVSALNRRYGKEVKYKPELKSVKQEPKLEFAGINTSLVSKTEGNAVTILSEKYGKYGFTFEETGYLTDYVIVYNKDKTKQITVGFDEANPEEALKLKSFLEQNASKENSYAYDKIQNKKETEADYYKYISSDEYKNDFKSLSYADMDKELNARIAFITRTGDPEKNTERIQALYKTNVYQIFKEKKKEEFGARDERIDLLYTELQSAKLPADIKKIKSKISAYLTEDVIQDQVKNYSMQLNDLDKSAKILASDQKEYLQSVEDFKKKSGQMTQAEFDLGKKKLEDQAEKLGTRADFLMSSGKSIQNDQKKLNIVAGKYFTEKEKAGSFGGGVINSLLIGTSKLLEELNPKKLILGIFEEDYKKYSYDRLAPEEKEYYKDKGYSSDDVKNIILNTKIKDIKDKTRNSLIESVGADLTTQEYMKSADRGLFEKAIFGVAESTPAMLMGFGGYGASFTALSAQAFSSIEDEMFNDADFETSSARERALVAVPYAALMGVLENFGLKNIVKGSSFTGGILKDILINSIKSAPKGANMGVLQSIMTKEVKSALGKGTLKIVNGAIAEFETGATQSLVLDIGLKSLSNLISQSGMTEEEISNLSGGEMFATPDTLGELTSTVLEDGLAEAIGGATMSTFTTVASGLKNGNISLYNEDDLNYLKEISQDTEFKKIIVANLKTEMLKGNLTKSEAQERLDAMNELSSVIQSIPDGLSAKDQISAVNTLSEKNRLTKEIQGKDPALVTAQTDRINEINEELKNISKNATKEDNIKQQEGTAEGGISEYQGTSEGQQEVGVSQGGQREATINEADSGDSTVASKVQQEEQVAAYRAEEQAELLKAIPKIESYKVNGEIDKTLMPKTVLAKYNSIYNKYDNLISPLLEPTGEVVIDKPVITTNTTAEVDRVKSLTPDSEDGATFNIDGTKYEGVGLVVPVDSMNTTTEELTPEMVADFVAERQKMIGDAGVVKAGIYKFPNSNQVSIDLSVVVPETSREQALEFARLAGQESLFDLATFENIKTGATGENPMSFSPEQHREISKALKEGRMPNVFGTTVEQEVEAIGQLLSGTDAQIDQKASMIVNKKISKAVSRAAKALSKIIPGTKFIVHDTDESYRAATKEEGLKQSSNGEFNAKTNTIHINGTSANARTVAHEVFHAILINKVKTDANAAAVTKRMVQDIASKINNNPELKKKLENFISNYEENIQNEEKLAELVGMLSENYNSFSASIKDIIARWIDKLANIFGLDPFNRNETYDMLNTIARKVAKGEVISEADVKIIEDVDNGESFESQYVSSNGTVVITPSNRKSKVAGTVVSESDLIDPKTLVGKPLEVFYYDNLTSSPYELKNRISGSTIERVGEGGPGYSYRPEIKKAEIIAAFTNVTKVLNSIQGIRSRNDVAKESAVVGVALQNKETGHLGNKTTEKDFYSPSEGVIAQAINDELLTENEAVEMLRGAVDAYAATSKGSDPKSSLGFTSNDFSTLDDFYKKIGAVSFERRGTFNAIAIPSKADLKITKATKPYVVTWLNSGIHTLKEYFNDTTEQYTKEAEAHDIVKYLDPELDKIGVDSSVTISEAEKNRAKSMGVEIVTISNDLIHTSYPVVMFGKNIGVPTTFHSVRDMSKDWDVPNPFFKAGRRSDKAIPIIIPKIKANEKKPATTRKQLAPNGKPSKLNDVQWEQVRTPAFKKWFGDWENDPQNASKVVDENGEPLVVYHGSLKKGITTFSPQYFGKGAVGTNTNNGYYFTSSFDNAEFYADSDEYGNSDDYVYSVFLSIKNPKLSIVPTTTDITTQDGIISKNILDGSQFSDIYVVFNPNQIKLADGTNTTFDSAEASIRKQLSPEVSSKLTEDKSGNFVFHHYSNDKRDVIKPGTGENIITGKEEGGALSAVGGLAMYYTMDNQVEPGVGNVLNTVLVPNGKVYDFNSDPDNFYDEAKKRFEATRPSQSFNPNYQLAFITQVANENGYDMVVTKWRNNELRAQTTMSLEASKDNVSMKPIAEETYKVGDNVEVYGSKGKITSIDGDIITFKGEGVGGQINFKRFPKNISKQITPRKQIAEEVTGIEESISPRKQKPESDIPLYKFGNKISTTIDEDKPISVLPLPERFMNGYEEATGKSVSKKDKESFLYKLGRDHDYKKGGVYIDISNRENKDTINGYVASSGEINIDPNTGKPSLSISENILDAEKKSTGRIIKTNLFKKKAGWNWKSGADKSRYNKVETLVSVEVGSKHVYTLGFKSTTPIQLKNYSESKSEPRLRPTTNGQIFLGNYVGDIVIRGKTHPVYDNVYSFDQNDYQTLDRLNYKYLKPERLQRDYPTQRDETYKELKYNPSVTLKDRLTDADQYIFDKLGIKNAEYISGGVEASVYDIGMGRVIRISKYPSNFSNNIVNKKIEGVIPVYSTGKVILPKRMFGLESYSGEVIKIKSRENRTNEPQPLYYSILKKGDSLNVKEDLNIILNKLVNYIVRTLDKSVRFTSSIEDQLSILNEQELDQFKNNLDDNQLKDLNRIIEIKNNLKEIGIKERDSHTGNYVRNSNGDLEAIDFGFIVFEEGAELPKTGEKNIIRKQQPMNINDIVKLTKAQGFSDAAIRQYLKDQGYSDKNINDAMEPDTGDVTVSKIREASKKELLSRQKKMTIIDRIRFIRNKIIDRQSDIKRLIKGIGSKESIRAYNLLVSKAGASGFANYRFKNAEADIYKGLSKNDLDTLEDIIYARRMVAINESRAKKGLEPYTGMDGYSEVKALKDLDAIKNKIGEKKFNDLSKRATIYFGVFSENLKKLYESGRINEETYINLRDIEYSPIKTIKYIIGYNLDAETIDKEASKLGVSKKDILALTDSNENAIIFDSKWLLLLNVMSVEGRAFENKMLNEFSDAIDGATQEQRDAMSEFIIDNPIVKQTSTGSIQYKYNQNNVPVGYSIVSFFKNGVKKDLVVKEAYATQLLDIKSTNQALNLIGTLTGAKILRFFATGGNPLFIIGNTAVDFQNILFFSDVYSKFKLFGGAQLSYDFVRKFLKGVSTSNRKNKIYNEYVEHGGAMDFLSNDGLRALKSLSPKNKILNISQKVLIGYGNIMSYLGEKSELAFRLAVYDKVKGDEISKFKKENGRDPDAKELDDIMYEATRNARETMDFNQGGSWVKAADNMMPYLNASMQGFRRPLEYAKNNPLGFTSSLVQASIMAGSVAALSLAALIRSVGDDDEEKKKVLDVLDSLSDYEKATHHIIFTGKKDKDGEYEYYRIKKLPVLSVMSTITEQFTYKYLLSEAGIKYDVDQEVINKSISASTPFTPSDIASRNPLISGLLTYSFNWDSFTGEKIFREPRDKKIAATAEGMYDDKVDQIYKEIAPSLGLSPIRTKAAIEKIVTSENTNPMISIFYASANGFFNKDGYGAEFSDAFSNVFDASARKLKRFTNKDNIRYKEEDNIENLEMIIETDIYNKEQKVYNTIKNTYKDGKELSNGELIDLIKTNFEKKDYKKYAKKYYAYIKNMNIDRSVLDILYEETPEVQALRLYNRYGSELDSEEKNILSGVMRKANMRLSKQAIYIYNKKYSNRK
jgi:hypothetical protein